MAKTILINSSWQAYSHTRTARTQHLSYCEKYLRACGRVYQINLNSTNPAAISSTSYTAAAAAGISLSSTSYTALALALAVAPAAASAEQHCNIAVTNWIPENQSLSADWLSKTENAKIRSGCQNQTTTTTTTAIHGLVVVVDGWQHH